MPLDHDHDVTIQADPVTGGEYAGPLYPNAFFLANADHWEQYVTGAPIPVAPEWTAGSIQAPAARTDWQLNPRPPTASPQTVAAETYRARVAITASTATTATMFFYHAPAGFSPDGPDGVTAEESLAVPVGDSVLDFVFDASSVAPGRDLWFKLVMSDTGTPGALIHSFETNAIGPDPVSLCDMAVEISINHGRDNAADNAEASTATITLDLAGEPVPDAVDIGAVVAVTTTPPGGDTFTRFVGRVTDIELTWEETGADTPNRPVGRLIAVSFLADLGRRIVGTYNYPVQLDGARVAEIVGEANVRPGTIDPGTISLVARPAEPTKALELAQQAAIGAVGILWQDTAGRVNYTDADGRDQTVPSVILDACDVDASPVWTLNLDGTVNTLAVTYVSASGENEDKTYRDPVSIGEYGELAGSLTIPALLAGADEAASLRLARDGLPRWALGSLGVNLGDITPALRLALLSADVGTLVQSSGFPTVGDLPSGTLLWLEGWSEVLAYRAHYMELFVSVYEQTAKSTTWNDAVPEWTWDASDEHMTWNRASDYQFL